MELYPGMKLKRNSTSIKDAFDVKQLVGPIPDNKWGMWAAVTAGGQLMAISAESIAEHYTEVVEPKVVKSLNVYPNTSATCAYPSVDAAELGAGNTRALRIDIYDDGSIVVTSFVPNVTLKERS